MSAVKERTICLSYSYLELQVFDHISRYLEDIFEDRSCGILSTNFEVFGNVVKHCLSV